MAKKKPTPDGLTIRNKGIRRVSVADIIDNPKNYRTHGDEQTAAFDATVDEIGWYGFPDVFLHPDYPGKFMLIDGELRSHCLAERYGSDAAIDVNVTDFDPIEADKALATKDPLAAMAGVETEKLESLLRETETESDAFAELISSLAEQEKIELEPAPEIIEDAAPPVPDAPIAKPGDIWTLGSHRLLCGDSTNRDDVRAVLDGTTAEIMFTDPPYGVDYVGGYLNYERNSNKKRTRERLANDCDDSIFAAFLPVAMDVVDGPSYMFFSPIHALPVFESVKNCECQIRAVLIWNKTNAKYAAMNAQYKPRYETFLYFNRPGANWRWSGPPTESTVWDEKRDPSNDYHPTQKPVRLPARAIANHTARTVFEPFAGSGSTLIAAEQLGRICFAIEIDPGYCDVIVDRWQTLTGQAAKKTRGAQ